MPEPGVARRPRGRGETGSATVVTVGLIVVLMALTVAAVALTTIVGTRHRAESAADLGALAGAVALRDGGNGCAAAARVASVNDAALTSCAVADRTVEVRVSVTTTRMLGRTWELVAAARAGSASTMPPG